MIRLAELATETSNATRLGDAASRCPNVENGRCTNAINSCGDIPTCIACISEAAVDQAIGLYYGMLIPTVPRAAAAHGAADPMSRVDEPPVILRSVREPVERRSRLL